MIYNGAKVVACLITVLHKKEKKEITISLVGLVHTGSKIKSMVRFVHYSDVRIFLELCSANESSVMKIDK